MAAGAKYIGGGTGTLDLDDAVFSERFHGPLVHEAVRAELSVGSVFEKGQTVKVSGTSKGKGFAGTIKRHNFHRGPVSHGSHNVRAPGSIGASADPARVFKGIRGPGQMGNKHVTQRGLEVVDIRNNLLLVRGSVPGPKGGVVEIRSDS